MFLNMTCQDVMFLNMTRKPVMFLDMPCAPNIEKHDTKSVMLLNMPNRVWVEAIRELLAEPEQRRLNEARHFTPQSVQRNDQVVLRDRRHGGR